MRYAHFVILCVDSFSQEFISKTSFLDLVQEHFREAVLLQVLFELMNSHLCYMTGNAESLLISLKECWVLMLDLDLKLVASSELVFDMLYFSKALEDTTFDHDPNLR